MGAEGPERAGVKPERTATQLVVVHASIGRRTLLTGVPIALITTELDFDRNPEIVNTPAIPREIHPWQRLRAAKRHVQSHFKRLLVQKSACEPLF